MSNKVNILVCFKSNEYKDYISLKNKFNELINNEKYYYLQKEFCYTIEFEIDLVSYENYKNEIEKLKKEVK